MIKKLLLLLPLLAVNVTGLISCGTCIGVKPQTYCIQYTDINVSPLDISDSTEPAANEAITFREYAVELSVNFSKRSCSVHKQNNLFGTTTYACSIDDMLIPDDQILEIEISSDADFDDMHKAGTNLVEYFSIPELSELNTPDEYKKYYLYLNHAPDSVSVHSFSIRIKRISGDDMVAATTPVLIKK